jgi:3-oxoadipate enol-lactonase
VTAPVTAPPTLTHRIEGDGPAVVLLNGGMMSLSAWEPLAARLRERYRVLRFDFRGQLLSPGAPPSTLAGHASDVAALLDHVGWRAAHFVGTSYGAEVAIELAAQAPERALSLFLVAAMDRATPEFRRQSERTRAVLAEVLAGGERGPFFDLLVEGAYSPAYRQRAAATLATRREQIDQLPLAWFEGVLGMVDAVEAFDLGDRLSAVRAPACVVLSRADAMMDPERSRALAAAIGAELVEHPNAGHALVAEEPEWIARVLLRFLAAVEEETR